MASKAWQLLGVSVPFDPALQLVSSPVFQPVTLAVLRLTFAVYTFVTLLFVLIWDGVVTHTAKTFFSYFTELSYIGICAYFWAAGTQTTAFALNLRQSRKLKPSVQENLLHTYPLQRWPKILQFLHILLWSTVTTFPFLVTVVFWALLSGPATFGTPFDAWSNISLHALNSIFALFEIFFTCVGPQPWIFILFFIVILGGYLGIAYITHATQGIYPYPFLDPKREGRFLAAYIVGIPAIAAIVFCIVRLICLTKVRLLARTKRATVDGVEMTALKV